MSDAKLTAAEVRKLSDRVGSIDREDECCCDTSWCCREPRCPNEVLDVDVRVALAAFARLLERETTAEGLLRRLHNALYDEDGFNCDDLGVLKPIVETFLASQDDGGKG